MKKSITLSEWPLGVISDCHGHIANVQKILSSNPNVKNWICLGDIVDFLEPANNRDFMDYWLTNCAHIPMLRGNHEEIVQKDLLNINFTHRAYLVDKLFTSFDILLPNRNHILCYHNKPKCNWSFVDKNYTEREFVETYLDIGEHVQSVAIGHNYEQWVLDFPNTFTQIWSIGAVKFGSYAIIDKDGLHHKRIKQHR